MFPTRRPSGRAECLMFRVVPFSAIRFFRLRSNGSGPSSAFISASARRGRRSTPPSRTGVSRGAGVPCGYPVQRRRVHSFEFRRGDDCECPSSRVDAKDGATVRSPKSTSCARSPRLARGATFHSASTAHGAFFLLCRTPTILRPVSSGRRSRTIVSTSGSSHGESHAKSRRRKNSDGGEVHYPGETARNGWVRLGPLHHLLIFSCDCGFA